MPLTKTTIRALAASTAFVAAGVTLAGAAIFHVPVLGFSRASAATRSAAPPVDAAVAVRRRTVAPVKIVRTRYVDDIVHRPAPVGASRPAVTITTYGTARVSPTMGSEPAVDSSPTSSTTTTTYPSVAPHRDGSEPHDGTADVDSPDSSAHTPEHAPSETVDQ